MKRWYVAHTLPKGEALAMQHLARQNFEAFLPRYHRVRKHARKTDVIVAPLFPRYLFVKLDLENDPWLSIESTRGIAYIVRQCGRPASLPSGIVENLQQQADVKEIVPLSSLEIFKPGAKVEILDGAFLGHTASYEKMADKERVQLLLNMLGREVRIEIPINAVMAVA